MISGRNTVWGTSCEK